MSIVSRTYAATPGATQVIHFTLTNARILGVKRSGITHYPGVLTPGNLEFVKIGPVLNFQIPFSGDLTDDPTRKETVFVLFET
jgi:hypothetical protein